MTDKIFLDFCAGDPGSEQGDRPIMVEENANCAECGSVHDIEACPKCGASIELGYGLAFGGVGAYKYCSSETCDWSWKREDEE